MSASENLRQGANENLTAFESSEAPTAETSRKSSTAQVETQAKAFPTASGAITPGEVTRPDELAQMPEHSGVATIQQEASPVPVTRTAPSTDKKPEKPERPKPPQAGPAQPNPEKRPKPPQGGPAQPNPEKKAEKARQAAAVQAAAPLPTPQSAATATEPDRAMVTAVSAAALREMRRKRARSLLIRVLAMVVLPTLAAAVYFGFLISSEYESECQILVEHREPVASDTGAEPQDPLQSEKPASTGKRAKAGATTETTRDDALLLKEFIQSRGLLDSVDKQVGLLEHYRSSTVDLLSRLRAKSNEQAFQYYTSKLSTQYDAGTGVLTVRLRAFDSEMAQKAMAAIVESAEGMLVGLRSTARRDLLSLAKAEVTRAKAESDRRAQQYEQAKAQALAQLQALSEAESGQAKGAAKAPVAPRLSPSTELTPLVERLARAQDHLAQTERHLARLEEEAKLQDRYVVRISEPTEPDEPAYPRRSRAILTTFLFSIVGMGVLSLLFSAVREHANL